MRGAAAAAPRSGRRLLNAGLQGDIDMHEGVHAIVPDEVPPPTGLRKYTPRHPRYNPLTEGHPWDVKREGVRKVDEFASLDTSRSAPPGWGLLLPAMVPPERASSAAASPSWLVWTAPLPPPCS